MGGTLRRWGKTCVSRVSPVFVILMGKYAFQERVELLFKDTLKPLQCAHNLVDNYICG